MVASSPSPPPALSFDEVQKQIEGELNALTGLSDAKRVVTGVIATVATNAQRKIYGLSIQPDAMHMLAVGNPGTGKSTTCRKIAGWLHSLGALRTGVFIEASRTTLVAEYEGQSAPKATKVLHSALGGMLFIDEAHQLVQGREDVYGKEALGVLVSYTENYRDDLIVVMAGYQDKIYALIQHDPGLKSRFPHTLCFTNYSAEELLMIATKMATDMNQVLTPEALEKVSDLCKVCVTRCAPVCAAHCGTHLVFTMRQCPL